MLLGMIILCEYLHTDESIFGVCPVLHGMSSLHHGNLVKMKVSHPTGPHFVFAIDARRISLIILPSGFGYER